MTAVFSQYLARNRGQIIGWGIGLGLLALLLIAFYSSVEDMAEQLEQMVAMYPPELMAFFGDISEIGTPSGYLSAEFFSIMPVILGIFTLLAGSGLIASDEENGTLDLIAAQPISRTDLFMGRLLAFLATTALILLITWLALWGGGLLIDFPATGLELLMPFLSLFALSILYGALGLFLSMLLPSRRMAAMATAMVLIASYVLTSLANVNEDLQAAADFSPFTYYQSGDAMLGLNVGWLLGLLALAALFIAGAWWRFLRRDIRVAGEGGWRPLSLRRRPAS